MLLASSNGKGRSLAMNDMNMLHGQNINQKPHQSGCRGPKFNSVCYSADANKQKGYSNSVLSFYYISVPLLLAVMTSCTKARLKVNINTKLLR